MHIYIYIFIYLDFYKDRQTDIHTYLCIYTYIRMHICSRPLFHPWLKQDCQDADLSVAQDAASPVQDIRVG